MAPLVIFISFILTTGQNSDLKLLQFDRSAHFAYTYRVIYEILLSVYFISEYYFYSNSFVNESYHESSLRGKRPHLWTNEKIYHPVAYQRARD